VGLKSARNNLPQTFEAHLKQRYVNKYPNFKEVELNISSFRMLEHEYRKTYGSDMDPQLVTPHGCYLTRSLKCCGWNLRTEPLAKNSMK